MRRPLSLTRPEIKIPACRPSASHGFAARRAPRGEQAGKSKITIQNAKIISNLKLENNYFKLVLNAPRIAESSCPGQFIEIKVADDYEPLLRRPFSIHRVIGKNIEILYEIKGRGTEILSQKNPGEYLDIIGPLGRGFDFAFLVPRPSSIIIVAGGMGVAPLVFLVEELVKNLRPSPIAHRPSVLIGARTKNQVSCKKEFEQFGCDVKIATDDGSWGFKGRVTDLLQQLLSTADYRLSTIYACGPMPMLAGVNRIAGKYNIPAQVSLEAYMACGIGACLGCVINAKDGYKCVCKDGPVFRSTDILWQEK